MGKLKSWILSGLALGNLGMGTAQMGTIQIPEVPKTKTEQVINVNRPSNVISNKSGTVKITVEKSAVETQLEQALILFERNCNERIKDISLISLELPVKTTSQFFDYYINVNTKVADMIKYLETQNSNIQATLKSPVTDNFDQQAHEHIAQEYSKVQTRIKSNLVDAYKKSFMTILPILDSMNARVIDIASLPEDITQSMASGDFRTLLSSYESTLKTIETKIDSNLSALNIAKKDLFSQETKKESMQIIETNLEKMMKVLWNTKPGEPIPDQSLGLMLETITLLEKYLDFDPNITENMDKDEYNQAVPITITSEGMSVRSNPFGDEVTHSPNMLLQNCIKVQLRNTLGRISEERQKSPLENHPLAIYIIISALVAIPLVLVLHGMRNKKNKYD